jgi:glycosyltransferase involved in cell wall biosynthesis
MDAANVTRVTMGASRASLDTGGLSFASVVHINEKGGSFGGTEEYISLVTAALSAHGVRSSLVCGVVTGSLPAQLDEVRIVPGLATRRPRADTAEAVATAIVELDADLVYVHNVFDPAVVPTIAALDGRGVLLWYVHDHYLTCLSELRWRRDLGACPHRLGHGCLQAIGDGHCVLRHPGRVHAGDDVELRVALSHSLGAADAVVVVSDYMRALLDEAEPHLRPDLHLLTRPIRDRRMRHPRHRAGPHEPAVVTYAGRINAEKGLAVVIEALGIVRSPAPVELRIAGVVEDETYWAHCQQVLAAARTSNSGLTATYLGHLDYHATDELFAESDIVTIPSRWPEPLGAVALEAMRAGAAVVASSVGGLGGVISHDRNGLHARPGDVRSWADAVSALLEHPPTSRRLGQQGQRDVAGLAPSEHVRALDTLVAAHRTDRHPPRHTPRIAS